MNINNYFNIYIQLYINLDKIKIVNNNIKYILKLIFSNQKLINISETFFVNINKINNTYNANKELY